MCDGAAIFEAGREFVRRNGRLLERRAFAAEFEGAPTAGVLDALRGYRNADGGFGHGLEPDKLCPDSLAVDDQIALQVIDSVGATDDELVGGACDHLAAIAQDGAVPLASPAIERYPRAEHWAEWTYEPALNPTAGLAGLLHKLGVEHPWRSAATAYCWDALEEGLPDEGHALGNVLEFLAHVDDRARADAVATDVQAHLPSVSFLRLDAEDPAYGVTPLHFAPGPTSPWRTLFSNEEIAAHLDRMERDQLDDGGWSLTWEPPGPAATLAYRGMETIRSLRVLAANGRIAI